MQITINQLINILTKPINPNTYLTFTDLLPNTYPKMGEDDEEYLKDLYSYFQTKKTLILTSGETGEIISEIPLQNYNNQLFPHIQNTNYLISIF